MKLAVASKINEGVKNNELRTMLRTHCTPLSTNAPKLEQLRLKSREYVLLKLPIRSSYYKTIMAFLTVDLQTRVTTCTSPRRTLTRKAFVQTAKQKLVSAFSTFIQGMKAIVFSLKDENASDINHEYFIRG